MRRNQRKASQLPHEFDGAPKQQKCVRKLQISIWKIRQKLGAHVGVNAAAMAGLWRKASTTVATTKMTFTTVACARCSTQRTSAIKITKCPKILLGHASPRSACTNNPLDQISMALLPKMYLPQASNLPFMRRSFTHLDCCDLLITNKSNDAAKKCSALTQFKKFQNLSCEFLWTLESLLWQEQTIALSFSL
jgi:hypothetical protein